MVRNLLSSMWRGERVESARSFGLNESDVFLFLQRFSAALGIHHHVRTILVYLEI